MDSYLDLAGEVIARCRALASHSDEPGFLMRTFLSAAMRSAYAQVSRWMEDAGMSVHIDDADNLRGCCPGAQPNRPRMIFGSHLTRCHMPEPLTERSE